VVLAQVDPTGDDAPRNVRFFNDGWESIGNKKTLAHIMYVVPHLWSSQDAALKDVRRGISMFRKVSASVRDVHVTVFLAS